MEITLHLDLIRPYKTYKYVANTHSKGIVVQLTSITMTSESENVITGNLAQEIRNAQQVLRHFEYINVDMGKLDIEVHKVQKEHRQRLAQPESDGVQRTLYLDTCIGNLTREVRNAHMILTHGVGNLAREIRNAQMALIHLENNTHKLEEKARKAQKENRINDEYEYRVCGQKENKSINDEMETQVVLAPRSVHDAVHTAIEKAYKITQNGRL